MQPASPATPLPRTPQVPDALEQHDRWRQLWRIITADGLLLMAVAVVGGGLLAASVLPQMPSDGQQNALAFSQWQTRAQDVSGGAYGVLSDLGLFNVMRVAWFRLVMAVMGGLALIRLIDRLTRLRPPRPTLEDETRLRVTEHGPGLDALGARLRALRYRTGARAPGDPEVLAADRGALSALLSIALHLGLVLIALGASLNATRGWELLDRQIDLGGELKLPASSPVGSIKLISVGQSGPLVLRLGDQTVSGEGERPAVSANALTVNVTQHTNRYRLTAHDAAGAPLTLTVSSFAPAETAVILTDRPGDPEQAVLIERARMVVLIPPPAGEPSSRTLRALRLPDGASLGEWTLASELIAAGVTIRIDPLPGAIINVRYAPGSLILLAGLGLAGLGALGVLLWPRRRVVLRRGPTWTEVYASGRGVRGDVARLRAEDGAA